MVINQTLMFECTASIRCYRLINAKNRSLLGNKDILTADEKLQVPQIQATFGCFLLV